MVRLGELSRVWARRVDFFLADDLLNEAIQRALDGRRRWPTSLDLMTFMSGAMRSIAGEWRARALREVPTSTQDIAVLSPSDPALQDDVVATRQLMDRLAELLGPDPTAMAILRLRSTGATEREICAELHIDRTRYDTDYRRGKRELLRLLAEGSPL